MTWGVDANVKERFEAAGIPAAHITTTKDTFAFASPDVSPAELIEIFRNYYGPTMNAFEAARKNGTEDELAAQLVDLATEQNNSRHGGVDIAATFLRVEVRR